MHPPPETSRLCRLIDESLRPFTSPLEESEFLTSQKSETQLLISLSQVFKRIQLWTNEFDCDFNDAIEVRKPTFNRKPSSESECPYDNHDCLNKIFGDMILLLSVKSQFVQHLAENILVAISDYLVVSLCENLEESNWAQFVKSVCICLELSIPNALMHSLDRPQCSADDASHAIIVLQPKLKRATWSSVASILRVLRTILKHMKQDIDDELLQVYIDLTSASLANVPWDVVDQNWNTIRIASDSLETKAGLLESRNVFHGALVQLVCSLVNLVSCESAATSFKEHPIICQISNLTPTLSGWCLERGNRNNLRMFEYFRHKILILMIRLISQIDLKDSLLVSWLNIIHEYFEDLLLLPMTQPDQGDTLEDSPFMTSTCDTTKKQKIYRHLQRLVILLFLRCSFSLIGLVDKRPKLCGNDSLKSSCKKKGLSELQWWLQIHLPSEKLRASECYFERCTNFSKSFLRLFIHEDDILFELLLLLFCMPLYANQQVGEDICAFQEMNVDIIFHVSNILNPIQLFHLFLSELHYDHQVLLDYLISKDTGASSAEYLLRSLRVISDSWTKFVEFSLKGEVTDMVEIGKSSGKKRKALADGSKKGNSFASSLGKHHVEHHDLTFKKAKDCLLLLKKTLENLNQKKLFPYNPKVLLIRLERFEELCLQH